jgi:hypothetical protein
VPIGPDLGTYLTTLLFLVLGAIAVAAVILAVAVAEHNIQVIAFALSIIGLTGRIAALLVAIFLYSLALINAIIYIPTENTPLPFQVGPSGLVALIAAIGISLLAYWPRPRDPQSTSKPVP